MHFSRHVYTGRVLCIGLCLLGLVMATGCKDNIAEQNDVFPDARRRVVRQVLPEINAESQAVLRNLVNLLTVFPEVCATPLARMGTFTSALPALAQPVIFIDDPDAQWIFVWSNVILGDDNPPTTDLDAAPVDITLTATFRAQNEAPLRALPFSLAPQTPQTTLQTVGIPPSFTAAATGGFFLYQDDQTGAWILRWRALGGDSVFAGTINASTGISRLIRHLGDPATSVASLNISGSAQEVTFSETTPAGNANGFTFYVRPGDTVEFRLRLGTSATTLRDITASELRIGREDAFLPTQKAPGDFFLWSSVPVDPTGDPMIVAGTARGTFLWQDTSLSDCTRAGKDQWRLRFTTPGSTEIFSGEFIGEEDDATIIIDEADRPPFGPCSSATGQRQGRAFSYECALQSGQLGGYDVCLPAGTRITTETFINSVRDPALVFIGAERFPPPSPDPFTILFDVLLEERNSTRQIKFSDAALLLRGNINNNDDEDDEDDGLPLDPDQASFEPPCVDGTRLLARLTEEGDYSTERFEGGRFILDNVEFLANNAAAVPRLHRFPDRGIIQLDTRVESEETEIKALMETTRAQAGDIRSSMIVFVTVNKVLFTFPNESAVLTVD